MARSGPEVADVFRRYGEAYRESHGASLCTAQRWETQLPHCWAEVEETENYVYARAL
jgi:hypothetical protein